jgi:hypothetical protein
MLDASDISDTIGGMTEKFRHPVLDEIEAFLEETGMGPVYFGKRAAHSDIVEHLRGGGDCRTRTIDKVRAFMADERAKRRAAEQNEAAA